MKWDNEYARWIEGTGEGIGRETIAATIRYSSRKTEKYAKPLSRETAIESSVFECMSKALPLELTCSK
jgi:hypothetical protein